MVLAETAVPDGAPVIAGQPASYDPLAECHLLQGVLSARYAEVCLNACHLGVAGQRCFAAAARRTTATRSAE